MASPPRPPRFRGVFRTDEPARAVYAEAAGIGRAMPIGVAVPDDADDAAALVRWARSSGTPLVPRGSGSSMAGGAIGEGVIVDLSRLRAIGDVNAAERSIVVGPGALCGDVDAAARRAGLRFPVDPSSASFCTVGGMASTNAAGAHTLRFGAMRAWVRALDCVFDGGERALVRRGAPPPAGVAAFERLAAVTPALRGVAAAHPGVRKDSSGYDVAAWSDEGDLVGLLVGSEGTLALFVGLELALLPLPGATSSVLGAFASLEDATAAAVEARASGAVACELLDRTFLEVAASGGRAMAVPSDAESVLMVEIEGSDASEAESHARAIESLFRRHAATAVVVALDVATERELWELRHAASPILSRLDPALKSMQFIEDGAVPPARLPEYVRGVRAALARQEIRGVIFGHAGDAHVHVNPLVDVRRPDWRQRIVSILDEVTALAASLGGTIAGEHGDGRLRAPLLPRVWPAGAIAAFAAVKHAFDPAGILNPGAKVALPRQQPLGAIKYDPSLAPLPEAAARALAQVERDRAYATSRLELLES